MNERRPSPKLILAVLAFGVFVAADDLTVVSTMLRQIVYDLNIPLPDGLDQAAWIVNAYLIAYVVVMPFIGRISDIFGRRAVYVGALTLFLAGSIWVPFAPDLNTFLAGRVLTALGGGAMVPVSMAVIADVYEPRRRATALGVLGSIDTAGWVWGPLYGALLIRFLDWRWQFYLNIPLSLIGIAAAWWALRDLPKPAERQRVDWVGAAILTVALLALNIGLLNSGSIGSVGSLSDLSDFNPTRTLPYFALFAVTLPLFIYWQHHVKQTGRVAPLIDLSLWGRRNFSPAVFINFLVGSILIIAMVNVPLLVNVLEVDIERSALTSGFLLSAMTGVMAITAYLGGRGTERFSYRPVTLLGLALCGVGFALLGSSWHVETPYATIALQLALLGAGFGLVTAPVGAAVINAAPEAARGIAASLVIVFRLIGMSVGLSGLTAWGLTRFNLLRTDIDLPPITDPGFAAALEAGLTNLSLKVLAETFIISAVLALLAIAISLRLHRDGLETSA